MPAACCRARALRPLPRCLSTSASLSDSGLGRLHASLQHCSPPGDWHADGRQELVAKFQDPSSPYYIAPGETGPSSPDDHSTSRPLPRGGWTGPGATDNAGPAGETSSATVADDSAGARAVAAPAREPFKILFCGSDDFSVASLDAVRRAPDVWQSIHVLTPEPKRVGRGRSASTYTPALLDYAARHALPTSTLAGPIADFALPAPFDAPPAAGAAPPPSHLLLTASFGHILPDPFLAAFATRLNVHPSLLPQYRGAAPVQWAIARGDAHAGVSVQGLVPRSRGIDGGDIYAQVGGIPIERDDTYTTLLPRLASIGGWLLVDVLRQLLAGQARPRAQDPARVTRAPKITHETARVRWAEHGADAVERLHRAVAHQAPLWTTLASAAAGSLQVQLLDVRVRDEAGSSGVDLQGPPGVASLDRATGALCVRCADGRAVAVGRLKSEGGRAVGARDWWNGLPKDVRAGRSVQLGT